jgi:hypothetical protein
MSGMTDYHQNKLTDARWRGQAYNPPATNYFGLICATKGTLARSTAYAQNDTVVLLVGSAYVLYKCTTAGTTGAAVPSAPPYAGARAEAITDGTAVFTEQSNAIDAGTFLEVSASGTGYARASLASSLANFAGTQAQGSTTVSTGSNGTTSNNVAAAFPTPTAQWHPNGGQIVGVVIFDASSGGNPWDWYMLSAPKSINNGDPAPSIPVATVAFQMGA